MVVYTNSARLHSDAVWLHGCMCSRWPGEPPVRSARARESPCGTCSAGTPESCVLKQHGPGTEVACAGQALTDGQQPNSGWLHPAGMARACTRNQTRLSICHVFQNFRINVSEKEKKWSTDLSTTNSNSLEGHRINYRKVSQRKTTRASLLEKKKGERKKFSYSFSSVNLPAVWHKHMWYLQLTNLILPWSWSRAGQ